MKFGRAFSDYVTSEGKMEGKFSSPGSPWWLGKGRVLMFATLLFLCGFFLLFRLFDLTVVRGNEYRTMADGNRTKRLIRHAPRGIIVDRTGKPLVENIPRYRLLKPCDNGTFSGGVKACASYISIDEGEALLRKGLSSGWFLEVDYQRRYLFPESLAHVIGYTGEVSSDELNEEYFQLRGYKSGSVVGRMGVEQVYEEKLRGRDGEELVEIDAEGTILRTIGTVKEVPGETIQLSIDASLSDIVMKSYPPNSSGAVIVTKPTTGEILALYSSPTYSLDTFTSGMTNTQYQALVNNPNRPMFNRAIGGVYPPGSTFKIVTAIGGIQEGVVKKSTIVEDTGEITIGLFKFPNWFFKQYGKTDGSVDIVKALKRSNDIFFYKVGEWLGITNLGMWAKKIGIGSPLGIELPGEASGLMPNPSWKKNHFNTPADIENRSDEWYLGDTYHVAIGQGYLLTTPLQVNFWTNVIANGGYVCKPTIKKIQNVQNTAKVCKDIGIGKETVQLITEGMREACSAGGTGYPLFDFGIRKVTTEDGRHIATSSGTLIKVPIACKTGTAEYGDFQNKTHAWFTAFAPLPAEVLKKAGITDEKTIVDDPEISITVLIEGAGEGSDKAAPVAKKIFEEWFSR